MLFSLRGLRRHLVFVAIAVGMWTAHSQSLSPRGPESRAHNPLGGDQVYPAASFNAQGGFLVWEDNGIDRTSVGIAGCRVDANLSQTTDLFRINRVTKGDQTRPALAVLPDGGVAFTFSGYDQSFLNGQLQDANSFLRFLRPDDRFAGKESSLNPKRAQVRFRTKFTRMSWRNNKWMERDWSIPTLVKLDRSETEEAQPVVLSDGRVLVVCSGQLQWQTNTYEIYTRIKSTFVYGRQITKTNDVLRKVINKGNSGREIFFQIYEPYKAKRLRANAEVKVNQLSDNHQRQPAVAVLSDGRFVVVWVSEDRVARIASDYSSVVVRARLFSPTGEPLGDEFVVNSQPRICARPVVAADASRGFSVAWNQLDLDRAIGWDIFARGYDREGNPVGDAFRVNEHQPGTQHSPRISGLGPSQLVVWTSQGQDGFREGVYGRLLTVDGLANEEFRINATTRSQQLHPFVISQSPDQFRVLWTSYVGEEGFEILHQAYRCNQPLPAPDPPAVAALDESSLHVSWSPIPALDLLHYEVFPDELLTPALVTGHEYIDQELDPGSTHTYRLAYRLADGRRSLQSDPASGTTLGIPAEGGSGASPSEDVSADGGGIGSGSSSVLRVHMRFVGQEVELSWNTIPGRAYQVQISDDLERWLNFGTTRLAEGQADSILMNPKEAAAWFRVILLP